MLVKTEDTPYQSRVFEETKDREGYGLLWSPGVGKTQPTIKTAAYLFDRGLIDFLLVVAPKGVHYNWVERELPKHMGVPYVAHAFDNGRDTAGHKDHARSLQRVLDVQPERLSILALSYHALEKRSLLDITKNAPRRQSDPPKGTITGRLADLVNGQRVMFVADESVSVKDHDGVRSKRARAVARRSRYRRILDGTPVDNSPFDIYAQMLLLDPEFWSRRGLGSHTAFCAQFAEMKRTNIVMWERKVFDGVTGKWKIEKKFMETVDHYKNLDQLREMILSSASRLTKQQAGLDLPPKRFVSLPFDMTKVQRKVYDDMRDRYMVEVGGELVTAPLALVRILRLQQIGSNFMPVDVDGDDIRVIDEKHNPRLELLDDLAGRLTEQGMIWARFRRDHQDIVGVLGDRVGYYDSQASDRQKATVLEDFRRGNYQFILGHTDSGLATGHTLVNATCGIYYNHTFKWGRYEQSQDRMHRIGQHNPVTYYSLGARDSVDQKIEDAFENKMDVSAETLGDKLLDFFR